VVRLDGEGHHDPAAVAVRFASIDAGEADFVLGSRYLDRQGCHGSRRSLRFSAASSMTRRRSDGAALRKTEANRDPTHAPGRCFFRLLNS